MIKNGVVYTPENIINKMISFIYKTPQNILEPSCGRGDFIKIFKSEKVVGYDIDDKALEIAKNICPKANLKNKDFLKEKILDTYDLIIGNPPYIRIHDLEEKYRTFIKNNFITCANGTVDIFFAFVEKSLSLLNDGGQLLFILPNTWLVNKSAQALRKQLINFDVEIYDFGHDKVFDNFDVYSCIISAKKIKSKSLIIKDNNKETKLDRNKYINGEPWFITKTVNIIKPNIEIKNGIATLSDVSFIFDQYERINNNLYQVYSRATSKKEIIEEKCLRTIIKASKQIKQKILYPYDKDGHPYTEKYIAETFPKAYNYLVFIKERLLSRTFDKEWFLFGRSQGIKKSYGNKVILSPLVNKNGFFYMFTNNPNIVVYSGFYAIIDNNKIEEIKNFFNNKKLIEFILNNGRKMSGGWVSFSKTLLENFGE